jgi:hypothetical protein
MSPEVKRREAPEREKTEREKRSEEDSLLQDHAFLGREFLTWLVWRVERGEATFGEEDSFTFGFGGRTRLQGLQGDVNDAVLKGPSPAMSIEARSGIGAGRTVREAELRISKGEREWRFTLMADTFDLRGVKLPALLTEEEDDRFLERISLLEELEGLIKDAFSEFLGDRLRPVWTRSVVPALRDWVADGLRV